MELIAVQLMLGVLILRHLFLLSGVHISSMSLLMNRSFCFWQNKNKLKFVVVMEIFYRNTKEVGKC